MVGCTRYVAPKIKGRYGTGLHPCLEMLEKLVHLLPGHLGSGPLDVGGSSQSQLRVAAEECDNKPVGRCVAHPSMGGQGHFVFVASKNIGTGIYRHLRKR
jgi:hypothetical protein